MKSILLFRSGPLRVLSWIAFGAAVFALYLCSAAEVPGIRMEDLRPAKGGIPGEREFRQKVAFGAGVTFEASIEVTSKGNGLLKMANLNLKVFDSHDDGVYYENGLLKIDFPDLDGDGRREIVISGTVCFTEEKTGQFTRREPIVYIFRLSNNSRRFGLVYKSSTFQIDGL